MRHERSSSTAVVIVVGLAALVQGFMPPPAPLLTARISAGSSRASTARPESTAASVTSCSTSRLSRTIACAAADSSTELLLDLENTAADGTPDRAPAAAAVEAGGGLEASGEGAEQEEEGKGEGDDNEEDSGWVEDSAELLSKGAGAIGAGVKSVALASKPLKREPSGRLVPDGQGLLNLVRGRWGERGTPNCSISGITAVAVKAEGGDDCRRRERRVVCSSIGNGRA